MTTPARTRLAEEAIIKKHCPNCQSTRIHRSHRKSSFDRMLCAIGGEIRRCHDCRSRQVWFRSNGFPLPDSFGGGLTTLALLGSAFLLCLLFIWWMITRFRELAG